MQISLNILNKYKILSAVTLAIGVMTGCSTISSPTTPENIVSQRAQQRVDWLLEKKYDQAYAYLTPSYRALNSPESYRGRFGDGAKWIEPKVANVECSTEERCVVTVKLKVLVVARGFGKPIDSNMTETWLKEDGQWWYYQH